MKFCPLCGSNIEGSLDHRCSIKTETGWEQVDPKLYLAQIIREAEERGHKAGLKRAAAVFCKGCSAGSVPQPTHEGVWVHFDSLSGQLCGAGTLHSMIRELK